jgi:hypothetical protein
MRRHDRVKWGHWPLGHYGAGAAAGNVAFPSYKHAGVVSMSLNRPQRLLPLSLSLVGLCLYALGAALGQGQPQLGSKTDLEATFRKAGGYSQLTKLATGQQVATQADKEFIDAIARWYVHRLTDAALRGDVANYGKKASELVEEFDREVAQRVNNSSISDLKKNRAFVSKLAPALVESLKPVFQEDMLVGDNRMVQVAAATLLPRMARLKQEDLGLYLAALVKDKTKHDAIRLYAMKGLKEFFPATRFFDETRDPGEAKLEKIRDLESAYIDALTGYVEGNYGGKKGEVDDDVIRYLRREALASLGSVQMPAIGTNKRAGQVIGASAPTLLKVLTKTGLSPEPDIHEKIEAAIGLAEMKYVAVNEYRPELAVYLVGLFVEEFARKYKSEWSKLRGTNAQVPSVAWKIQSKRLELAIKTMAVNAKPDPLQIHKDEQAKTEAKANQVMAGAVPILTDIYKQEDVPQQKLLDHKTTVLKLRPAVKTAFRDLKSPEIPLDEKK